MGGKFNVPYKWLFIQIGFIQKVSQSSFSLLCAGKGLEEREREREKKKFSLKPKLRAIPALLRAG